MYVCMRAMFCGYGLWLDEHLAGQLRPAFSCGPLKIARSYYRRAGLLQDLHCMQKPGDFYCLSMRAEDQQLSDAGKQ